LLALLLDCGGHLPTVGQRVTPAGLLEALDQHLLGGVEEEDPVCDPTPVELVEHAEHALEVGAAADVAHHCRPLHLAPLVGEQPRQRADHLGREVVDAEVAGVLEAGHRLGLPGAGEPGDDHEILDPLDRLGVGIEVPGPALAPHAAQET